MDGMSTAALDGGAPGFVRDIAALAGEVDRTGAFPSQSLDILQHAQMLAITARAEDGGDAAGLVRTSDLVRQVGSACASTGLILSMQLVHLRNSTSPVWPEHLRAQVGRSAARLGSLINALRVEPALGSRAGRSIAPAVPA
jgi:alkylation response protein AidB-like acyl-CoA dehydrogenase